MVTYAGSIHFTLKIIFFKVRLSINSHNLVFDHSCHIFFLSISSLHLNDIDKT